MAELNIFQQGDKVKFIVTSQNKHLDMEACDFYVELIYGMRRDKVIIHKEDFLYGTDGEYVMIFDTSKMVGKLVSRFVWYCIDTDCDPDNRRQEVDEQIIGFVAATPCPQLIICEKCSSDGHDVHYEHGEPYTIYRPLVTRNDEYIYVLRESADALAEAIANAK